MTCCILSNLVFHRPNEPTSTNKTCQSYASPQRKLAPAYIPASYPAADLLGVNSWSSLRNNRGEGVDMTSSTDQSHRGTPTAQQKYTPI